MPFQEGFIYPLTTAGRYDDEFGCRYDYALLADRGAVQSDCWVHDAWIVNADGEVHPGLSAAPVPVRLEHVREGLGRRFPTRI